MRIRFIRDDVQISLPTARQLYGEDFVAANSGPRRSFGREKLCWNINTEIENPDGWRLVQLGVAEPADEECEVRCRMNLERRTKAQQSYDTYRKKAEQDLRARNHELPELTE